MADNKVNTAKKGKKAKLTTIYPLEKQNFLIIAAGIVIIIVGYIALSVDGVEGVMPLVVAPILLVIGYAVVVPFGIMYKVKEKSESSDPANPS